MARKYTLELREMLLWLAMKMMTKQRETEENSVKEESIFAWTQVHLIQLIFDLIQITAHFLTSSYWNVKLSQFWTNKRTEVKWTRRKKDEKMQNRLKCVNKSK